MGIEAWLRSGLAVPDSALMDSPFPSAEWQAVFPVELKARHLAVPYTPRVSAWSSGSDFPSRRMLPGPGMLDDFLGLVDASAADLLAYAQRWGLLGLCPHGHGYCHSLEDCWPAPDEALDHWRAWVEHARRILDVAARLHRGDETIEASLGRVPAFISGDPATSRPLVTQPARVWRVVTSWAVQAFIEEGGGHLVLTWPDEGEPRWELQSPTLLGYLGIQIAERVNRGRGMAICQNCGRLYSPSRRPQPGRQTWCLEPPCKRAAGRAAERRYNAKRDGSSAN